MFILPSLSGLLKLGLCVWVDAACLLACRCLQMKWCASVASVALLLYKTLLMCPYQRTFRRNMNGCTVLLLLCSFAQTATTSREAYAICACAITCSITGLCFNLYDITQCNTHNTIDCYTLQNFATLFPMLPPETYTLNHKIQILKPQTCLYSPKM